MRWVLDDVHALLVGQFGCLLVQVARYAVVGSVVGYVRAVAAVEHLELRVFVELLQVALFLCLALLLDEADSCVECYGHRVLVLRQRYVLLVVQHVRTEASCAYGDGLALVFTDGAWQFEQFECFLQRDGLHALVGRHLCEAWLLVVIGCAYLHHRTVATNLHEHGVSAYGVGAQLTFTSLVLRAGVHHLVYGRLKLLVEVLHHVCPLLLAVGNLVELLLYLCREVVVHDSREVLHEEVVHYDAYVGR